MSEKDFAKMMNPPIEETEETVAQEVTTAEEVVKMGVVTDCLKLNVRKEPSLDADILCEITALSSVVVEEDKSTADFYKVCTEAGIEGYCMKKYIAVQQ